MRVTFDVEEHEDCAVAGGQRGYRPVEFEAVEDGPDARPLRARRRLLRKLRILRGALESPPVLPEIHEHHVDRQAVQPRGKGRLAAERPGLVEELDEDLLRQVFGLGFNQYLSKPLDFPRLNVVIEKLLGGAPPKPSDRW
jgi:hypothetical protein